MHGYEKVIREHIDAALRVADTAIAEAGKGGPQATQHYDRALAALKMARQREKVPQRLESIDKRIAAISGRCSRHDVVSVPMGASAPPPAAAPSAAQTQGGATPPAKGADEQQDAPPVPPDEWIMSGSPGVRFADIAGLDEVKRMISDALVLPQQYPTLYAETDPVRGIILYGPSGTGKTHIVRAIATEMEWTFLTADASQMFSRWQGDSEKAMKSLFETARAHKPCIVFLDEADAILGKTDDKSGSDSKVRVMRQFLQEMDGIRTNKKERGMVVVIATNHPWAFEDATKRRFEKQIEIPLPDDAGRRAMIGLTLRGRTHTISDDDVAELAGRLEGYSGADIQKLASEAFIRPIHRVQSAKFFRPAENGRWLPCDADDEGATEREWRSMTDAEIALPPATAEDWRECLRLGLVKPSNSTEMVARYANYTRAAGTRYGKTE